MSIKTVRNAAFVVMVGAGILLSVERSRALGPYACNKCYSSEVGQPQVCTPAGKGEGGQTECRDNMPGVPVCYTFGLDCTGQGSGGE